MAQFYTVLGHKGGIGKSQTALALVDYLMRRSPQIEIIETDTGNPDIGKTFQSELKVHPLRLADADGWAEVLNITAAALARGADVVMNVGAREHESFSQFGDRLNILAQHYPVTAFHPINRQRECLNSLKHISGVLPDANLHVVRNLHYGGVEKFELYAHSKLRGEIEARGSLVLDLPDLADRITDRMTARHLSFAALLADPDLGFGDRIEIQAFQAAFQRNFAKVLE